MASSASTPAPSWRRWNMPLSAKRVVLGKPAPDFFKAALASTEIDGKEAVMVGDDAEADVAGALLAGIGSALLVRSGKYRPGDETRVEPRPSETVADLAAAARWIMERRG